MIRAVFFDLGDTLWHFPSMPPVEVIRGETMRRITRLLAKWGYGMPGERNMIGRDIRLAIEAETERAFHGDCVDPGYPAICQRIARSHGMDLTLEQGAELWETWNLGGQFLGRQLFPDAIDTLLWLRDGGYRLASITNRAYSGRLFHDELRELGLTELFEAVVISCDVGYMKPHPRIFHYALERMGVEPQNAAMVGDSLRADAEGAKTVGMTAIWRRPPYGEPAAPAAGEPEPGPVAPDYTIEQIGDLRRLPIFHPGGPK
jgi:HAD superfamily hydrolase (TIGR01549 family)